MFKVLIIAYYFPPMGLSGVQRTLKFAKYMSKYNWKPTILTGSGFSNYAYDLSLLKEAVDCNLEIIRTEPFDPTFIIKKRSRYVRFRENLSMKLGQLSKYIYIPDNKVRWASEAYKKAKEVLSKEKFDVILVSCPPFSAFPVAAKLKKEFDLPVFVDYRDLWINYAAKKSVTPYHKVKNKNLEYYSLKSADKVVVVNRKIKEKLLLTYPFLTFDDIIIIPNGFDPEDIQNIKEVKRNDGKMHITYSGVFNEYASPKNFLEAFQRIVNDRPEVAKNIELHFIGNLKDENRQLIDKMNLRSYVIDHGCKEHKESLQMIFNSDILWMLVENQQNAYTVTGGKLFEYFGARKPIIACVPEGAASIAAQEYGAAFICNPNNIDSIKNTILNCFAMFQRGELPKPNEEFVSRLNRDALTEQLTKEFQFFIREI